MDLNLLSGGAAHGLIKSVTEQFESETGAKIVGTYGAVGAMKEKLLAGAPVDMLIVTARMLTELERDGHVISGSGHDIGKVLTSLAVRSNDLLPHVTDATSLRAALQSADAIYFPDPVKATAGIHFFGVLKRLGVAETLHEKLRPFPNGATAMATMAAHTGEPPIGCTQTTEIISSEGVKLAGRLPHEFELATVYAAGIAKRAQNGQLAAHLIELLTSDQTSKKRDAAGFGSAS